MEDDEPPPKPKRRAAQPCAAIRPPWSSMSTQTTRRAAQRARRRVEDRASTSTKSIRTGRAHNLPGRGCGGHGSTIQRWEPSAGVEVAALSNVRSCSIAANVCGGLRRAYEFGYQWHRKSATTQNT